MKKFDKIVIGSGSAGSVIASRLSENKDSEILLVEAGSDYPEIESMPDEIKYGYGKDPSIWARTFGENSKFSWNYSAKATKYTQDMLVPRGRVIGGSSSVNAQIFLRGLPEDFDGWASLGNNNWDAAKTMPYFKNIENDLDFNGDFHNSEGPIVVRRWQQPEWEMRQESFYKAARSMGQQHSSDANDPNSTGVGPLPFNNTNDGIRWSTNFGYLSEARHRVNLSIRANCLVRRILFDGRKAIGVELESPAPKSYDDSNEQNFLPRVTSEIYHIYGDEIILCAGAIGSPHILMLSGIGSKEKLEPYNIPVINDMPGIGENLRDHPQIQVFWKTRDELIQDRLSPRIQVGIRYTATGSDLRNDMFIHPMGHTPKSGVYLDTKSELTGFGMVACIYLAKGSGSIGINSSNPHDQPDLNYNFLYEEFDRIRLREATRMCVDLGSSEFFNDILEEVINPELETLNNNDLLDEWLMKSARTSHHVSGTCKMGPIEGETSVVDQVGKIHGLTNIRIADASIMPNCIRANTNATTIVIGERIADSIMQS